MSTPAAVVWHDLECGGYAADLPLWRELAEACGDPILDVGAGTGRVALDLARRGHAVTALDRDEVILAELSRRAEGLAVDAVAGDARELSLDRRFALCLVPMQTVQLLGGRGQRAAFLRRAREHLASGGLLAAALAESVDAFDRSERTQLPLPDVREHEGWVYASQPVGVSVLDGAAVIERIRQTVAPDGTRSAATDAVTLDRLTVEELAAEGREAGFEALAPREIAPTGEHVASRVALLRAP